MYSTSHPVSSASMNGMGSNMIDDGSGTINPAALNTPVLSASGAINSSTPNRGQKRSRSPEYNDQRTGGVGEDEDPRQKKRGRPSKQRPSDHTGNQASQQHNQQSAVQQQAPGVQGQGAQQQTVPAPTQASPPKATPTKAVVKALPTVRDHTTDQLSPEGDEYVPREYDDAGERKVAPNGKPQDGREYKCRTFLVPNRGDKLFMLATECARVLGYRDSYLLFNKNRSLYKIIATQPEKDDLIGQEILPYSYRSRQIAIVTAKSMFRQFGSRVIVNGRRVRDDYWEAKAKKQGFTEEDLAGEKRPGGAKAAREAQAAEAANAAALGHHQEVVYNNAGSLPVDAHGHPQLMQGGMGGPLATVAPLPMISLARSDDLRLREYDNIQRPRQEMTGAPYQDRTQPSSTMDVMNHANHTADFSKILNQQQRQRSEEINKYYRQPREVNVSSPLQQATETGPAIAQNLQSPHVTQGQNVAATQQTMMQQPNSQMITPQSYAQQQQHHQQNPSSSPARNLQQQMRQDPMSQQRSSSLNYGPGSMPQSQYGYPPTTQMWGQPPPQPQQSPLSSHHGLPQYSPQQPQHQAQSPHHSQSPHQHPQQTPAQLQHSQSSGSMPGGMYQQMPSMAQNYGGGMAGRSMYQQPPQQSPSPHQYMQQTSTGGGAPLQGWAPPPPQQQTHQNWQGYQ